MYYPLAICSLQNVIYKLHNGPWIIIIVYLGAGITIRTKKVCDVGIKVTRIMKLVIVYWLECVIKRS